MKTSRPYRGAVGHAFGNTVGTLCETCQEPLQEGQGYFRHNRSYHHSKGSDCAVGRKIIANISEAVNRLSV